MKNFQVSWGLWLWEHPHTKIWKLSLQRKILSSPYIPVLEPKWHDICPHLAGREVQYVTFHISGKSIMCLTPGFNLLTTKLLQHSMLNTSKNAIQEAISNEESLETGPFLGCNDAEQALASTFWKCLTELLKMFCSCLYYFLWLTAGVLIMGLLILHWVWQSAAPCRMEAIWNFAIIHMEC